MATVETEEQSELREIEEQALEHLAEEGLAAVKAEAAEEDEGAVEEIPRVRISVALACSVFAASVMVGGVFIGSQAYVWAAISGVLGILVGNLANRVRRTSLLMVVVVVGIFAIGLIAVLSTANLANVFNVGARAREAATSGDVLRPPVEFVAGWRAIVGWLMGAIGFAAVWISVEMKRYAVGLLVPLPLVAIGAISVPKGNQLASGLICVALFGIGLGIMSGAQLAGDERLSLAYELRRAARGIPMVAAIVGALFLLERFNVLFPTPLFDPAQEAQRPRTVPLSEVEDRVLFTVESSITGPWRMGLLDVYDGRDWRLPPFAESRLREVPPTGIVDSQLVPAVQATFQVADLGGAVLPGLPNTAGVVAEGPRLAYDRRTGNIRLAQGQIEAGLRYTVVAARIPTVEELRNVGRDFPEGVANFLSIPDPPPAVEALIARAPTTSLWDRLDFARQDFLKTVVASGPGTPVSVPPSKVNDMLAGSKEGSPFEIVAGQAMLARWVGVPSRIGYGFDGGERNGNLLEVRPKHGAAFMEVYFTGYGWLPVLGTPLQAASSLGTAPRQVAEGILPSNEVAVPILVAIQLDAATYFFDQVRAVLVVVVPAILILLTIYYTWPAIRKWYRRSRRRTWAAQAGSRERIAVAYADFRDVASDFGYRFPADTPLMFLDRVTEDDEHTELAWLVTRTLWGDLQERIETEDALAAEEISATLRKRLAQAHSFTLRFVAAVSRISLRYPYAPRLGAPVGRRGVAKAA